MDENRSLYETLEVEPSASSEEIRASYKRLARKLHPDLNPDDAAAEERFKAVSRAYGVLSNEQKRASYDEFGEISLEAGFDADEARRVRERFGRRFGTDHPHDWNHADDAYDFAGIDDLLGHLFDARGGIRAEGIAYRGVDLEAELELDFLEATRGAEKSLTLQRPTSDGGIRAETVKVRIPPCVDAEGRLRIPGKGGHGAGGGPSGDLWVQVLVRPHRLFRKEGRNVTLDLPLNVREAILGASVEIPTLDGRATVTIPPGTQGGARLRLAGKGVPAVGTRSAGDLIVRVQIRVPRDVDDETARTIVSLEAFKDPDLRKELFE
jgi:DnaJ-class molecular chaperone